MSHGKRIKGLNLFQISWMYLRFFCIQEYLFCFVFQNSAWISPCPCSKSHPLTWLSCHRIHSLLLLWDMDISQQTVRLGFSPLNLVPWRILSSEVSISFSIFFWCPMDYLYIHKWQNQNPCFKYKHFLYCGWNPAELPFNKWGKMLIFVIMLSTFKVSLSFRLYLDFSSVFKMHKNQESLQHWML